MLLGSQIETMSEPDLAVAAGATSVFDRLVPAHKERIIRALQSTGHVLGFMGDGINDAPALKAADVGISVDSAVDIAKESSDIILLENSLLVLEQGVLEGRRVFGNIVKYIKMVASSNFGNMFSFVGASAFLPIQVLTNDLLYDFSQTTIPTYQVDDEWLTKPRQWTIDKTLRFILFIGPINSIFNYVTFFLMLYVFDCWHNPALFHTGWYPRGPVIIIVVLAMMIIYKQLETSVLVPRIYGRALRLPSSVILFSLLAGSVLLGIIGALLALPVAAAVLMLIEELRVELPGQQEQAADVEIRERDDRSEE